jgi:hypothetical protein
VLGLLVVAWFDGLLPSQVTPTNAGLCGINIMELLAGEEIDEVFLNYTARLF